jgi:DNA-binding transcriptional ArsR family regulator
MAIHYDHTLDRTFHALGDPTRRAMMSLLAERGDLTAGELGAPFRISQPTASRHLRVLERAGLLSRRVYGRVHRFRLRPARLREAEDWIARNRRFWEGTLDRLADYLETIDDKADDAGSPAGEITGKRMKQ